MPSYIEITQVEHAKMEQRIRLAEARGQELEKELQEWPLHGEGRLTKSGWSLAQSRYRHVCEMVEEFRGYWTELQDSNARIEELKGGMSTALEALLDTSMEPKTRINNARLLLKPTLPKDPPPNG